MQEGETINTDQNQSGPTPPAPEASQQKTQIEPNVMAALSYTIPLIMGVVVLFTEKENRFVRFHAFQSIIFGLVWVAASSIAGSLNAVLIGLILSPIITVTGVILWFYLMWKAYNNVEYQLPFVGKIAYDQVHNK